MLNNSVSENGYSLMTIQWEYIPEPILLKIFDLLPAKSILNAGETCSTWFKISHDDFLWKKIFKRDFKCHKKDIRPSMYIY